LGQCSYQHGVVGVQAHVGDANLQGGLGDGGVPNAAGSHAS
jgi:hypothetical protein